MSLTICVSTATLPYPEGGHLWVYLNWALGLRANGCKVVWLEVVDDDTPPDTLRSQLRTLKTRLKPYGLSEAIALYTCSGTPLPEGLNEEHLDVDAALEADLLLNFFYAMPGSIVERFRRSALVDIDPGQLQVWMTSGSLSVAPHDVYFTIGEAVGRPGALFPDAGVEWHHVLPCVALDHWPCHENGDGFDRSFTTISHWYAGGTMRGHGEPFSNRKRTGFRPFLDLPRSVSRPMELTLDLPPDKHYERDRLRQRGWRVQMARDVASTPEDYQRYIQESLGEFSCAKPAYVRFQTGWISDRTACYLASGRPAVVQHTGACDVLPDTGGLFRFRTFDEARDAIEAVSADYQHQSRVARKLAEEFFDAQKVSAAVLERAMS